MDQDKKIETLAKIQKSLEEVEDHGDGKVVIFIRKHVICNYTIIKNDSVDKEVE